MYLPDAVRMPSSASSSSESSTSDSVSTRKRARFHYVVPRPRDYCPCCDYCPSLQRKYEIFFWHIVDEQHRVRRWFVWKFPIEIRESLMKFLDYVSADTIAELETEIHHPELHKARYRRQSIHRRGLCGLRKSLCTNFVPMRAS